MTKNAEHILRSLLLGNIFQKCLSDSFAHFDFKFSHLYFHYCFRLMLMYFNEFLVHYLYCRSAFLGCGLPFTFAKFYFDGQNFLISIKSNLSVFSFIVKKIVCSLEEIVTYLNITQCNITEICLTLHIFIYNLCRLDFVQGMNCKSPFFHMV